MAEIIEQRTRSSKRFDQGGGAVRAVASVGTIHYESGGQWEEVDAEFVPAVAPWDWQMTGAGYGVRVKEDVTAGQVVEFSKAGEAVTLQPMALQWTNDLDQIQQIAMPQDEAALVTNPVVDLLPRVGLDAHLGKIRWDDAYGDGIDLQWQCTPSRLAKILEIESLARLPVPAQYIIDGGNPVLRLSFIFDPSNDVDIFIDGQEWDRQTEMETFGEIEFRKDGERLWGFAPLIYWDANGATGQSVATLRKAGNSLYVDIRVPYAWLQAAVFPVFLDTDIDEQVGQSSDDAQEFSTSVVLATNEVDVGSGAPFTYYGGFRWTGVSIPAGATVDDCTIDVYVHDVARDDPDHNMHFQDANNPGTFTTGASNISNRTRTAASVTWNATGIGTGWKTTAQLKTVLQEVVDDSSGTGDALVAVWVTNSTTSFRVRAWDFAGNAHGAKLDLTYTEGGVTAAAGNSAVAALLAGEI